LGPRKRLLDALRRPRRDPGNRDTGLYGAAQGFLPQPAPLRAPDAAGPWGGAMGLTQFLPTEFYKYGVDFDHNGKVDIWTSVPDALASAAKQLVGEGWERDKPWAYEVRVPANADCTIADPDHKMPLADWLKPGFTLAH